MSSQDFEIHTSTLEDRLGRFFNNLALSLHATPLHAQTWTQAFCKRYTEPQRHYHTLSHVDAMLRCLDQNRDSICDEVSMTLAIVFHDWVYDPRGTENEIESIKAFEIFMSGVQSTDDVSEKTKTFIERTITHTLPDEKQKEKDADIKLFLDFDLEVLSRPREEYQAYARKIRQEYRHFGDEEFRKGRINVLKKFLERDRLYFSESFYLQREEAARRNIQSEIDALQGEITIGLCFRGKYEIAR